MKPNEILGFGETGQAAGGTVFDLVFRTLVLVACAFATVIALFHRRSRWRDFSFVPFLLWTGIVAILCKSNAQDVKQLGSYATWILFYIAASNLWERPSDYQKLSKFVIAAVVVSMVGGVLRFLIGAGPMIGVPSSASGHLRLLTGSGGMLLDSITPSFAAVLLFCQRENRGWQSHWKAWLLFLWGAANVSRGSLLAFFIGMIWIYFSAPRMRRSLFVSGMVGAMVATLLLGGWFINKTIQNGNELNTSGRLERWPLLVSWIQQEPVLGHGPNADLHLLAESEARDLGVAHNEVLSTGVNFGITGIVLLWLPFLVLTARTLRVCKRNGGDERLLAASAFLLAVLALSFTDNTFRTPGMMILSLSALALARAQAEAGAGMVRHATV